MKKAWHKPELTVLSTKNTEWHKLFGKYDDNKWFWFLGDDKPSR